MIVYKITNVFYGTSYVGQTVEKMQRRWRNHIAATVRGDKSYLHNAIRKYGPDAFTIEILHNCESREEMDFVEIFYITLLNTKSPNGYNLTDGGGGAKGFKHSEETKKIIAKSSTGRKPSEETLQRMKEAQKRAAPTNPGMRGHKHTVETLQKMTAAKLGKKQPKISQSLKGRVYSLETRRKISEGNRRRKVSEVTRQRMSESHKAYWEKKNDKG